MRPWWTDVQCACDRREAPDNDQHPFPVDLLQQADHNLEPTDVPGSPLAIVVGVFAAVDEDRNVMARLESG
jgi:hypothetical protein